MSTDCGTFRVSLDGKLLPIGRLSDDWDGGSCIARCAIGSDHAAPETDCTCGIYSFRDRIHLTRQVSAAHSLLAVVALEGSTVEGDRGWRSQAARVVALWIADDALPSTLRAALLAGLPSVREYPSPTAMIANFPGLTCSEGYPPTAVIARESPRRASTRIPCGLGRWSLVQVANFLFSVGITIIVLTLLLQTWLPTEGAGDRGIVQSWLSATQDLLMYFALNPGVLIAFFVTTTVFGVVFAIGQARKRSWLGRVTWRGRGPVARAALGSHFRGSQPALGDMVRVPGGQRADVLGHTTRPVELVISHHPWPGSRRQRPPSPAPDRRARSACSRNHRAGNFSASVALLSWTDT